MGVWKCGWLFGDYPRVEILLIYGNFYYQLASAMREKGNEMNTLIAVFGLLVFLIVSGLVLDAVCSTREFRMRALRRKLRKDL